MRRQRRNRHTPPATHCTLALPQLLLAARIYNLYCGWHAVQGMISLDAGALALPPHSRGTAHMYCGWNTV